MATKYEYRIMMRGEQTGPTRKNGGFAGMSHDTAVAWVRATLAECVPGTTAQVQRRRDLNHARAWQAHRAYVVDPGGIVRRTDR